MMHFLALSPNADPITSGLEQRGLNARHHVRKILALAVQFTPPMRSPARSPTGSPSRPSAPSKDHQHPGNPGPGAAGAGPLQLTRRHDLLDIDIAPPDLNAYQVNHHDPD